MLLLFTSLSLLSISQASVWENLNASIVVMEYQPIENNATRAERVLENTLQYLNEAIMAYVQNDKLDMIIFPEATLLDDRNTSSEININTTCNSNCDEPVRSISALARNLQSYIVVNLVEKEKCNRTNTQSQNCKDYGYKFYNTDVVFNRSGTIIERYRKYNLFGEYDMDKPELKAVSFGTDFNVTFGIFTCFDILFKKPAQDLVGVVDGVIFPTMWFSELPFLTAVQTQQMWAHAHDKVLFAAGANNPLRGSGGSGVYNGSQGALLSAYIGKGGSQAFAYKSESGNVSLSGRQSQSTPKDMDNFTLKRDKSLDKYAFQALNTSLSEANYTLCYNGNVLCCNFTIKISRQTSQSNLRNYTYLLVAFSGIRSFDGVYNGGVEVCGVLACLNSSLTSCGQRFESYDEVQWPLRFDQIAITANFEKSENRTLYPNSLLSSILPVPANETSWNQVTDKNVTKVVFSTTQPQTQVLTFAIYGRNFALDSPPNSNGNSGNHISVTFVLLFSCAVLISMTY